MAVPNRPTINDVARLAGVSPSTVSHVLNKTRRVAPETEERVLQAIKTLSYQRNILASTLRSQQSKIVGFITSQLHNVFWLRVIRAVEYTLSQNEYQMFLGCSYGDPEREMELIESMRQSMVAGLILATSIRQLAEEEFEKRPEMIKFLEDRCVFVDTVPQGGNFDFVGVNNEETAYRLTKILVDEGYTHLGIINGNQKVLTARERFFGFQRALEEANLELEKKYIFEGDNLGRRVGVEGAKKFLSLTSLPEAIFVASGNLMTGVLEVFRENKISIPQDIGVVNFDDIEWTPIIEPFLTCAVQPAWDIGESAVRLIMEKIEEGKGKRIPREIRLKCEVIVRNSITRR